MKRRLTTEQTGTWVAAHGDRTGSLVDPFGHVWYIATHQEDVTLEEIQRRAAALFGQGGKT